MRGSIFIFHVFYGSKTINCYLYFLKRRENDKNKFQNFKNITLCILCIFHAGFRNTINGSNKFLLKFRQYFMLSRM